MDRIKSMSMAGQIMLGSTLLYVIFSFFNWQKVCVDIEGIGCAGVSAWNGVGVIAGLLAIALLAWEVSRLVGVKLPGSIAPALVTIGLSVLLVLFTLITVLTHNEFRAWPQWIALILSIVIGVVAFARAREEGVALPTPSAA
jgi:hypothetical protein